MVVVVVVVVVGGSGTIPMAQVTWSTVIVAEKRHRKSLMRQSERHQARLWIGKAVAGGRLRRECKVATAAGLHTWLLTDSSYLHYMSKAGRFSTKHKSTVV